MADDDQRRYAAMSDAELRALEQDRTISVNEWEAVVEELSRRQPASRPRAAASASAPPTIAADEPRLAQALGEIRSLLVPGETLEAYAAQRRIFALTHRRLIVAATSGRL